MPKRDDIQNILLIGSGAIVIGQACEFDYSGTQAAKTLKELGYRVVLINSNPATIMTDPEFAHRTYIEPISEEIISDIIKKEKIDAILPTMGGQTALNVAMSMHNKGMLEGIKFLGANPKAIEKGEDRKIFKEAMIKIGIDVPKSGYAYNLSQATEIAENIGFPLIIRASFTLAGGGSGVAYNIDEFKILAQKGLEASPIGEILIEESLLGWKEYEMEVIRDKLDNCIIVCSIENLDPMGVHTGDSITIAPALTLTDKEYQRMRDASFKILREIGVDTGGSNVQFAINPKNGRMTVIEMNPRVSRSSALASKATGYPIAKVATLLAVGFSLDEIKNDITGTPASFEPTIDYIVTKIPRFAFEKFPRADSTLSTSMKSIGEVMAIGTTWTQSLQKALCSLENGTFGLKALTNDIELIKKEIRRPNANRILYIADGLRNGLSVEEIYELCFIDKWFLEKIAFLVSLESSINASVLSDENALRDLKINGFSDEMIAFIINKNDNLELRENDIFLAREKLGIKYDYNEVDTCAGEFPSLTPYLYSTMNFKNLNVLDSANLDSANSHDSKDFADSVDSKKARDSKESKKILILGSGPNRIGQGIEFDYCCVHASFALNDLGYKSVMYNCNPETVSTDYDTSDILYFEPITFEYVRSVIEREKPSGIIVHFGGQTPLKLAKNLSLLDVEIIGTSAKVIDMAEDREKFAKFLEENNLLQPQNGIAFTKDDAYGIAFKIGFPILVRPSYVLGGRAMKVVYNEEELRVYMEEAINVGEKNPILIDKFLDGAIELDVDAISDGSDVYVAGIMQHIEEAGIHSGDSTCVIPTISIPTKTLKEIENITHTIALKLGVIGLMNIQYAIFNDQVYIIEVNPRASRTTPFVSKATGIPLAKVATLVMCGKTLKESLDFYDKFGVVTKENHIFKPKLSTHISVKESVFPFSKLSGADVILGPEMKSTGEVMGISDNFGISFAKSQIACNYTLPKAGNVLLSIKDSDKKLIPPLARKFIELGFNLYATGGTYAMLESHKIPATKVLKISEGRPNIHDLLANKEIDMLVNTSDNKSSKDDAKIIREQVIRLSVPYFTTISGTNGALEALKELKKKSPYKAKALQDYLG
ncbi:carbamoyl phosphate synthase large subunit [Helicobacter sp. 16-1353]|uniref:carbamoyl-phosphate synthase large subunit n=1 Tax=Helicobacter sp. 16-1353 TaxID=2004996 RepID=UPI000DCBC988|nr:carbamoyl-phosphate synthase large subunit [Helicobacter sp. 16-1353]RAX54974.1 carbamoyl phosphate synthase large subunit [Helicobacter sp. 16-1353]